MSYKPKTLFSLVEEINKTIFLPHIQRPFVWEEDQILRLFDSLMRGYPIQTLLFWRTKNEIKARKFMENVEWDPDLSDYYDSAISRADVDKTFVLDGQQRIQSLYAIFKGTISSETGAKREAYFDITSGIQPASGDLAYSLQFSSEKLEYPWFRISDLLGKHAQRNAGDLAESVNETLDKNDDDRAPTENKETPEARKDRQKRVRNNVGQLTSLLREEKHFWIQTLDGVANDYPYKRVLEIFVRVNSGGTKLDASDLMFAAMKEGWDEFEQAIEDTTELLNGTKLGFDKTFPIKCLLVAHGKGAEASAEKFTDEGGEQLLKDIEKNWDKGEVAFKQLRDFMTQELKIYSDKIIRSYNSFIPLFDYLYHNPKPTPRDRNRMRAYHYKAQLFGWYSQGTDTTINALHNIVGKEVKEFPLEEIKKLFEGRYNETQLKSHHLKENRLRFILLNLIYVSKMGTSPFDVKLKGNEPHIDHIYPKSPLKNRLGFKTSDINHLGNYRFVGATDNIRKRAELPSSYFTRLKLAGIDIKPHLLVDEFGNDPAKLKFDNTTYLDFRDRRLEEIWTITSSVVNSETLP